MKRVLKYQLSPAGRTQSVVMPEGSMIVHVAAQHDQATIWAEVLEDAAHFETRVFQLVATGYTTLEDNWAYVGTCHIGELVWHIYEQDELRRTHA